MLRRFRLKKFKSSLKKIFTRKCIIHGKIIMSHKTEKEPNLVILLDHLHHTPRQKVAPSSRYCGQIQSVSLSAAAVPTATASSPRFVK